MKALTVLTIGLLAGIVIGRCLPRHSGSTAEDRSPPNSGPVLEEEPGVEEGFTLSPVAPREAGEGASVGLDGTMDVRASKALASAALDRVTLAATADVESGSYRTQGTVVDHHGRPLAGVTVVAKPTYWYLIKAAESARPVWPDLNTEIEAEALEVLERRRKSRMAVSGPDGSFILEGLQDHQYSFVAELRGYQFNYPHAPGGERVQLVAEPAPLVEFDVRLPDGSQPEEAVIKDVEDGLIGNWTPEERFFRCGLFSAEVMAFTGDVHLDVSLNRNALFKSAPVAPHAASPGSTILQLEEVQHLWVAVTAPVEDFQRLSPWVRARRVDELEAEPVELNQPLGAGDYRASDLPPGRYEVSVGRGGQDPESSQIVTIGPGLTRVELTLGPEDPTRFIRVHCFDPSGYPLRGVEFSFLVETTEAWTSQGHAEAIERVLGTYWMDPSTLRDRDEWKDQIQRFQLQAASPVYGTHSVDVDLKGPAVEIRFREPATLTVGVEGQGDRRLWLGLVGPGELDDWAAAADINADGEATLGPVQPGAYGLELLVRVPDGPPRRLHSSPVAIQSGEQTLRVLAPSSADLKVRGNDLTPEGPLVLHRLDPRDEGLVHMDRLPFGPDRTVVFGELPSGRYVLVMPQADGEPSMTVDVPCGEIVFESDR